jgi:hypothetical protein
MFHIMSAGDLGKNRYKFLKLLNTKVGKGNWWWGFRTDKNLYSWQLGMQFYEDAYWSFFRKNISALKETVSYDNVFVLTGNDIEAGLDYNKQVDRTEHLEDIAVRRSLRRLGVWFKGENLYKIERNSFLCSKNIDFHLPHLLKTGEKTIWHWLAGHRVVIIADEIADQHKLAEVLIR